MVEAFKEIQGAYDNLLVKLKEKFDNRFSLSPNKKNIKSRAKNVQDFGFSFRDDAFIKHIINAYGSAGFYELIMGFAANKSVVKWDDKDIANAIKNLFSLIESFENAEKLICISEQTKGLKEKLNEKQKGLHNLLLFADETGYSLVDIDACKILSGHTIDVLKKIQEKLGIVLKDYEDGA